VISRREFLLRAAGGAAVVSVNGVIPPVLARAAARLAASDGGGSKRVLVVIGLYGGNDGLNTVIPFADDEYRKLRPTLAIAADKVLKLTDAIGLHPALTPLKTLFDAGKLAVVQGVGYPEPSYSHFQSMDVWMTADLRGAAAGSGWLGRAVERWPAESRGSFAGVSAGGALPLALRSSSVVVPAVGSLDSYRVQTDSDTSEDAGLEREVLRSMSKVEMAGEPNGVRRARAVLGEAIAGVDALQEGVKKYKGGVTYPSTELGRELGLAAKILAADLGTRIVHVAYGGFDTHANQAGQHERLLAQLGQAIAAFLDDLKAMGRASDVTIVTMSEFGRRIQENGSQGTDHGTAAPLFAIGDAVKAGVHGATPSLTDLYMGRDLKFTTDLRAVYATLLDRWLELPSESILGAKFESLAFLGEPAAAAPASSGG
jgi:uncharacterized protein (DUF1501 family)